MQDFKITFGELKKTGAFLLTLGALLLTLSRSFEKISTDNDSFVQDRNKHYYLIRKETPDSIDALVVGDSLSYSSVSTIDLWNDRGIRAYICGQSGQKIQETYYMLRTALQYQKPKVVVMETNTMFRGKTSIQDSANLMSEWLGYKFSLFKTHDLWKSFVINKQYTQRSFKGFSLRQNVQPYTKGQYMIPTEEKQQLSEVVTYFMDKIIELCKEKNTKLLLVSTPSPMNYTYKKINTLRAYAQKHQLDYLDMNVNPETVGINWETDSLDNGDHLNLDGAKKVTKVLGKYLTEQYNLKDYRNDPGSSKWLKQASNFITGQVASADRNS